MDEAPVIRDFTDSRCDRCGGRAYHIANLNGLELSFCEHHYRRSAAGLSTWMVVSDMTGRKNDLGIDDSDAQYINAG